MGNLAHMLKVVVTKCCLATIFKTFCFTVINMEIQSQSENVELLIKRV